MIALGFHTDCASLHFGRFSLARASSAEQLRRARVFRRQVFASRRGIALDDELEARRDEGAYVFLLHEGATLVASARVSSFPSALSPLPTLLCMSSGADSELGRFACLQSQQHTRYSVVLLTLGARFLLMHTDLRRYVAYAHPKLCAQHGRLGAVDTGERCIVPRRDQPYHVLTGTYADTLRNGSTLLGIDDLQRSA